MIRASEPVTWLAGSGPRRPINCSLCGALLGSWYQYQTTFYPHLRPCSAECERLLAFAAARQHVPRQWREYPSDWRMPLLASAMIEREALR